MSDQSINLAIPAEPRSAKKPTTEFAVYFGIIFLATRLEPGADHYAHDFFRLRRGKCRFAGHLVGKAQGDDTPREPGRGVRGVSLKSGGFNG